MTEQQLHRAVAEYLTHALPQMSWFSTFPAGGGGKIRGAHLKAMGLKPGVPDILIINLGRAYWIELKAKRGRVSQQQTETRFALARAMSPSATCRSIEEVEEALRNWGIPLRASARKATA